MYLDAHNLFSDAQAITSSAASTNLIDLGVANRNLGVGQPVYVVVQCDVAMTDASSNSTVAVTIEQDTAAAFSSATAVQTIGTFAAVSAVGTRIFAAIQPDAITERYIRVYYNVANGVLTTGSFTAYLTDNVQAEFEYPDGFTIS